jgi:4-amino-4-deoxy-L-arabinose transferase
MTTQAFHQSQAADHCSCRSPVEMGSVFLSPSTSPVPLADENQGFYSLVAGSPAVSAAFLALLFLCAALLYCGGWGVLESSEARYAEISREMLMSQDWLHPRLLSISHLHKPPVVYWITALGLKLFGVNPFGARFFLQVSFVLQALLVFRIGCLLLKNYRAALLAMAVYLTLPAAFIASRNLTTDSFLTTLELLAIMFWISFRGQSRTASLYGFYGSLGLAMLTKGPVGLLFPLLVCCAYRPGGTAASHLARRHLYPFLLFFLLAFSWYGMLIWNDPRLLDYFLVKHTVERMVSPQAFGRSQPWWFFLALAPLLSLPWSMVVLWQRKILQGINRDVLRLLLLWLGVPLVVFSLFASKLILYILPLFPGLALLTGALLETLPDDRLRKVSFVLFLFFLILALGILLMPLFARVVMPGAAMGMLGLMLLGLVVLWRFAPEGRAKIVSYGLCFSLFFFPLSGILLARNPQLTGDTQPLADLVQEMNPQNHPIILYNKLLPSLAFHLNLDLVTVVESTGSLKRETQFESDKGWKSSWLYLDVAEDRQRLHRLLAGGVIVVAKRGAQLDHSAWGSRLVPSWQTRRWQIYGSLKRD